MAVRGSRCFCGCTWNAFRRNLASIITKKLTIPTIGIGAGAGCDGQILVYQDMLGMFSDYVPKFVKRFADVGSSYERSISGVWR